ncbi:putative LysR-family transcriptional regulator [Candidatus Burkholderia humilis]|nr:putative LysR-family transcriptional regulator [Candidatus Burkholderia humilis]
MNIRYVQSFVAVVESGSIAEAARRFGLTATAVAARIRSLEESLGITLIQRSGRNVGPTAEGVKVLDSAQDGQMQIGELRVGMFQSAMVSVLPSVLQRVYASYPDLKIFMDTGSSVDLCKKVCSGELDVAIVVEPQFAMPKTGEWHPLTEEPLIVVAHASMAGRDAHELLTAEPFVRYARSVLGGQLADRYLHDADLHPRQRLEIDGLLAIATLVDKGLGVSLVPDWPSLWTSGLAIIRVALPERAPVRRIGLAIARQSPRFALVKLFSQAAATTFNRPHDDMLS